MDFRPGAVWHELSVNTQAEVRELLQSEGHDVDAWPEIPRVRAYLVFMAAARRVARLQEVGGLSRTNAFECCALDFGLAPDSLRRMFWRVSKATETAPDKVERTAAIS